MQKIIGGKIYNTETMTVLASCDVYSNGNYCGSDSIRKTPRGNLCLVATSNGQDLYRHGSITPLTAANALSAIDGWKLDDAELTALAAAGVAIAEG